MRPWQSGPPSGAAAHGLQGLPGPSRERGDQAGANLRLRSRRAGFLPGVAAALAFGLIPVTLDRTTVGLTRQSTLEPAVALGWLPGSPRFQTRHGAPDGDPRTGHDQTRARSVCVAAPGPPARRGRGR